jgi:hypothetical protein
MPRHHSLFVGRDYPGFDLAAGDVDAPFARTATVFVDLDAKPATSD